MLLLLPVARAISSAMCALMSASIWASALIKSLRCRRTRSVLTGLTRTSLWAGFSRVFRDLFDWTQSITHPMPKIALFPVVAVVLGFTDVSRVLVIALSAFYPAYLNAVNGALGVNPRFFWVARNAGAGRLRLFWQVLLPASLPRALVGLRIALMVSFVLMVATEVVGQSNGLGSALMKAYREGQYGAMYAGILSVALCGMMANAVLGWMGRRWVSWHGVPGGGHV